MRKFHTNVSKVKSGVPVFLNLVLILIYLDGWMTHTFQEVWNWSHDIFVIFRRSFANMCCWKYTPGPSYIYVKIMFGETQWRHPLGGVCGCVCWLGAEGGSDWAIVFKNNRWPTTLKHLSSSCAYFIAVYYNFWGMSLRELCYLGYSITQKPLDGAVSEHISYCPVSWKLWNMLTGWYKWRG